MQKQKLIGINVLLFLLLSSCVPYKKMIYLRSPDKLKSFELKEYKVDRQIKEIIQPGDELYIRVTTSDERPTNFVTTYESYILDITLRSYTVSDDGYIRFPYLGKVFVQDKSIDGVAEEIELALRSYLLNPSVFVKFVNKKITVIGEVHNPGVYFFYDKNINILQAVAYAGDITTFGNRTEVLLIREEEGKIKKYELDLTDENLLKSDFYVIKPEDIIYVEPLRSRRWGFESFPYALLLTVINTGLLIWVYVFYPRSP